MSNLNSKILNESVDVNSVVNAIKKRIEVRVSYKSDNDTKGTGERIIQPVAYGLSKAGNPVVRAFQPFGDTKTKIPHWKLFRLDKFTKWTPLKRRFNEPPQFPFNAEGKFNPNGDKSMSQVFVISDFVHTKERYERGGLKKYNQERNALKQKENPFYNLQKNIEKSHMATPEVMKRVKEWQMNKDKTKTANEMSAVKDYGDKNYSSTNGVITKDNSQDIVPQNTSPIDKNTYNSIVNKGPITKQ